MDLNHQLPPESADQEILSSLPKTPVDPIQPQKAAASPPTHQPPPKPKSKNTMNFLSSIFKTGLLMLITMIVVGVGVFGFLWFRDRKSKLATDNLPNSDPQESVTLVTDKDPIVLDQGFTSYTDFLYIKRDAVSTPPLLIQASSQGEITNTSTLPLPYPDLGLIIAASEKTSRVVFFASSGTNLDLSNLDLFVKDLDQEAKKVLSLKNTKIAKNSDSSVVIQRVNSIFLSDDGQKLFFSVLDQKKQTNSIYLIDLGNYEITDLNESGSSVLTNTKDLTILGLSQDNLLLQTDLGLYGLNINTKDLKFLHEFSKRLFSLSPSSKALISWGSEADKVEVLSLDILKNYELAIDPAAVSYMIWSGSTNSVWFSDQQKTSLVRYSLESHTQEQFFSPGSASSKVRPWLELRDNSVILTSKNQATANNYVVDLWLTKTDGSQPTKIDSANYDIKVLTGITLEQDAKK